MTLLESDYGHGCCLVCSTAPVVVVADSAGDEALMCHTHWQEALARSGGLIRAIRLHRPLEKGAG